MIRFLIFVFVILIAAPAPAQERVSPGRTPQTHTAPQVTTGTLSDADQQSTPAPRITGIIGGCFKPDGNLTVSGSNLSSNPALMPVLRAAGRYVTLDVINRSDTRLVVRLQNSELPEEKTYELGLMERDHTFFSAFPVPLCPQSPSPGADAGQQKNLLIMAAADRKATITSWLKRQGITALTIENLSSLDSVLITVAPVNSQILAALRSSFPDAAIDWDDDLAAAKGPRVYARQKIGWPDNPECLPRAHTIKIGLIDGVVDSSSAVFKQQKIISRNFTGPLSSAPEHATAIASILIGNDPGQGFDGLIKGQDLYSAVALRSTQDGQQLAAVKAIALSLDWLLGKGIRLINISMTTEKQNAILKRGIAQAADRGALIFAAAGNGGPQAPPAYPAAYDPVIAVTAIDAAGRIYGHANSGSYIDFAAPGVDIWVAGPKGGSYESGTSFAAPYALAAAAVIMRNNPAMPRDVILKIMKDRASGSTATPYQVDKISLLCTGTNQGGQ